MNHIEQCAAFGSFAIEFEQICNTMESGIQSILDIQGLKNERIHEILLAGLTAEPLSSLFRSLCFEHLKPNESDLKIIDCIFKEFDDLIPKRNDLIHGKWWPLERREGLNETFSIVGKKLHKNKRGSKTKELNYDAASLTALYKEAITVHSHISRLRNCIAGNYPISNNFYLSKDKNLEPLSGLMKK